MKTVELTGELREKIGKKETNQVRNEGKVPCVLYGGEGENIHFKIDNISFEKLINTSEVYIFKIVLGSKEYNAILQEIQFHPVKDNVLHVDFLQVLDNKPTSIRIPIKVTGVAEGVKQGGKLQTKLRKLKVKGLAKDLPETLNIDVTNVALGKTIKVENLSFDNLELLDAKNAVVIAVQLTRSAMRDKMAAASGS